MSIKHVMFINCSVMLYIYIYIYVLHCALYIELLNSIYQGIQKVLGNTLLTESER
jgi:hypothetical protein